MSRGVSKQLLGLALEGLNETLSRAKSSDVCIALDSRVALDARAAKHACLGFSKSQCFEEGQNESA